MKSETLNYGTWHMQVRSDGTALLRADLSKEKRLVTRDRTGTWKFGEKNVPVHGSLQHDLEIVYLRLKAQDESEATDGEK